jgi:cytochrome P450
MHNSLHHPPPRDPHRDPASGVWILSRYAQVLAAFRDARLHPVDAKGDATPEPRDESGALLARRAVMGTLSSARVGEWQARIAPLADQMLDRLADAHMAELLSEFARPWCLSLAVMVTGARPDDAGRLDDLGARVSAAVVNHDVDVVARAGEAAVELDRYFANSTVPMATPMFIGVSQTLPRLLVSGWNALFQRPDAVARLRAEPALLSNAVEEMLRLGGLTASVCRKATVDVDLGFVQLAAGDRVTLMIGSANHDPEQFPHPYRLDVSRRQAAQLSLGFGHASCAAARLIHMAHATGLAALLTRYEGVDVAEEVRWEGDAEVRWPESLRVRLGATKSVA